MRRPVVGTLRPLRELTELCEARDLLLQACLAIERFAPPRSREVAVLGEVAPGLPEQLAGRRISGAHLSPQEPAHALQRRGDHPLEPAVEGLVEEPILLFSCGHFEHRIDAGFHGPFPEEVGAEGMDGTDGSGLQPFQGGRQPVALFDGGRRARLLQLGSQAQLHFTRRQVGEGDGQDAIERGPAGADERDDPRHELGGLAGASGRLHHQGGAEIRLDALPRPGVGEGGGHGMLLSCTRACSASAGLRRVRFHSEGPQTAR